MNLADWATLFSIAGPIAIGLWAWAYRRYLKPIRVALQAVLAEQRPNGGSSLRDVINGIRKDVAEIRDNMAAGVHRNRSLLQSYSTPVFETDANGDFVWVNDAYLDLVGHALTDITQSGWFTHVRQEERAAIRAEWIAAIEQVRNFDMNYTIHNHKQNATAYVRARAAVLLGQSGAVMGYLGTVEVLRRDVLK